MKTSILIFLLGSFLFTKAQKDAKTNELTYGFSFGAGIGKSPNFEDGKNGISAMLEFALQKNKSLVMLTYHTTGEFEILGGSVPAITMSSLELLYGRILSNKKIQISINTGVAMATDLERGAYLYSDPGFFGPTHYEKLRFYTISLPISAKFRQSSHSAIGLETYLNLNKFNNFYGLNLIFSFSKNKFKRNKKN